MESLNQGFGPGYLATASIEIAGILADHTVLDLGCGNGKLFPATIPACRQLTGIDISADLLDQAREANADAISQGRLRLIQADIEKEIELDSDQFDAIICHDVFECIAEKARVIDQVWRLLKPGGTFLASHKDFGAVVLNSSYSSTTRKIVQGYADYTQDWMPQSDGEMGRKLPGIFAESRFRTVRTETRLLVDLELGDSSYARNYLTQIQSVAEKFGVSKTELERWLNDLNDLNSVANFYFAIPWTYVSAQR